MNVQGGLFLGLIRKASLLVDQGQADIWVGHKRMHNVDLPRDISRRWGDRIRSVPGVLRAEPYLVGFSEMTLPEGGFEGIVIIGVESRSLLGGTWNITQGTASSVLSTDGVVVDLCDDDKLGNPQVGDIREVAGKRVRIAAKSQGVTGFMAAPYVFTTYDRAQRYLNKPNDKCSYFLVQLAPGANVDQVRAGIHAILPEVDARSRNTYSQTSVNFWLTRTSIGISFGAATLIGLLVGLLIVAQTLYALVLDRLTEFATLKAIGVRTSNLSNPVSSSLVDGGCGNGLGSGNGGFGAEWF